MDYRNLPPGLERRLTYSYHIRTNEPLISVRSNNRTFRINTRYERTRNWRIRTNIELDTNVERIFTRSERENTGDVRYTINYNIDDTLDNLLDTEIPNGNLSELTSELANLIIENQQHDHSDTYSIQESIPESIQESLPNTEIDEIRGRGMFNHRNFNNLIDIEKGIISKNLVEKSKVVFFRDRGLRTPATQHDNESDKLCCICRENFEYLDITRQLFCEHIFHINCIDTWFTKNKTCPECRYEI